MLDGPDQRPRLRPEYIREDQEVPQSGPYQYPPGAPYPGQYSSRFRVPEISRKLCWATWILSALILAYDVYMPDIVQPDGKIIPTVRPDIYYFLAFMLLTFTANYSRSKIVEAWKLVSKFKSPLQSILSSSRYTNEADGFSYERGGQSRTHGNNDIPRS